MRIPIRRIMDRLDACLDKKEFDEAERLLQNWTAEAEAAGDLHGKLTILNEQIGLYRKLEKQDECLAAINAALKLADELGKQIVDEQGRQSVDELSKQSVDEHGRQSVGEQGKQSVGEQGRQSADEQGKQSVGEQGRQSADEQGKQSVDESIMPGTVEAATTYLNAATGCKAFDRTERAIELYRRAQRIYEAALEPDDERLAGLYNNLAIALVEAKEYAEARELYEKALQILDMHERGVINKPITYLNLADLVYAEEGPEAGEESIEKYLALAEEILDSIGMDCDGGSGKECCGMGSGKDSTGMDCDGEADVDGGSGKECCGMGSGKDSTGMDRDGEAGSKVERDGCYAFVCEKCAPVFGFYGHFLTKQKLMKRAEEWYERS